MKNCPSCGAQLSDEARFCPYCMTSLNEKKSVAPAPKKRFPFLLFSAGALVLTGAVFAVLALTGVFSAKENALPPQSLDAALSQNETKTSPAPETLPEPSKCLYTWNRADNRLYIHILDWPYITLRCPGLGRKVEYAQFLHDASEVRFSDNAPGEQTDPTSPPGGLTLYLPEVQPGGTLLPVIELFLKPGSLG